MIQNPTLPTKDNPQLLDLLLDEVSAGLAADLSWLNNAFGKCERIAKQSTTGANEYEPAIFKGGALGTEYELLFPDSRLGNFCFFDVPNEQVLQVQDRLQWDRIRTTVGLIFWFDFRTVYPSNDQTRTIENVKSDVLRAIRGGRYVNGGVKPLSFFERVEDIYRGYSYRDVERDFLFRPYAAFRLNLEAQAYENC